MIILDKERFDVETIVADSNFVKVMKFPVRYGNIASLNDNPQNVIITQILANKLFGDRNPIGEKITYSTGDPLTVTGVIVCKIEKVRYILIFWFQINCKKTGSLLFQSM